MKRLSDCSVIVVVWLVSACSTALAATTPDWMMRPGTIGHAMSLADGSQVSLDAVLVDKIHVRGKPIYFTVRECFQWKSCLIVYAQPSPLLRHGQTVDVEGVLTTLPNGHRAIVRPKVLGYLDKAGKLLYHGPLIKWAWSRTLWEWKIDLTVTEAPAPISGALSATETPPGEPNTDSISNPIFCTTIADAWAQYSPTERVRVELHCRPLANPASGYFTLEEDGSADSITVYYTGSVIASDRINKLIGTIQNDAGTNYWLEVDSGPNWQSQDPVGTVQPVQEGSIAWAKTVPDGGYISDYQLDPYDPALPEKVVSRAFPNEGYFYIQESDRANGIRIVDGSVAAALNPGDTVTIYYGDIATVGGERVINSY